MKAHQMGHPLSKFYSTLMLARFIMQILDHDLGGVMYRLYHRPKTLLN